jgi:hypothetical protein
MVNHNIKAILAATANYSCICVASTILVETMRRAGSWKHGANAE